MNLFYVITPCLKALVNMIADRVRLASAKSNGALLVSATDPIKKIKNIGNKGTINQTAFWASIFIVKFKLLVSKTTKSIAELKINS